MTASTPIAILCAALTVTACGGVRSADTGAAPAAADGGDPSRTAPSPGVAGAPRTTKAPQPGGLPDRILLTGELRAVRSTDILAPRNETWSVQVRWILPEGTEVQEGQPVLELDNTAVLSKLEEQRLAHVESAIRLRVREAELVSERADKTVAVEKARIELEKAKIEAGIPEEMRARRTYEEKKIALEKARAAHASAERDLAAFEVSAAADLDVLRLETSKAQRNITRARATLQDLSVKAPRAGVLIYGDHPWQGRKLEAGDEVWPGLTVLRIPDLREMEVLAWLSDSDEGAVEPGRAARCVLDTYADRVFTGRIGEVADVAEERGRGSGVRAFRVVVRLDVSDPNLMRPGMSVKVEVNRGPRGPIESDG